MGILGVRTGGESDVLMASSEVNIEPCDKCVDEVTTPGAQLEGDPEREIGCCAFIQVKGQDGDRVRYGSLNFDRIDQRLG